MMGLSPFSGDGKCHIAYRVAGQVYFSAEYGVNIAGDIQKRFNDRASSSRRDGT